MPDRVVVIGGGFVGQLVQLAHPAARVLDWRKEAPIDHMETRIGPQYLWEPIPGSVFDQSFPVTTLVDGTKPTPEKILAYKKKIGKENDGGDWGLQFQYRSIGWYSQLPKPRVEYDQMVMAIDIVSKRLKMKGSVDIPYDVLVSTIPMPAMLDLLSKGLPFPQMDSKVAGISFKMDPIYMRIEASNDSEEDGMLMNYLTAPHVPWYRVTLTGGRLFFESLTNQKDCKRIYPGKIHPHPHNETIIKDLQSFDIFCYGRFATWRPDELAHQTWKEIEKGTWRT